MTEGSDTVHPNGGRATDIESTGVYPNAPAKSMQSLIVTGFFAVRSAAIGRSSAAECNQARRPFVGSLCNWHLTKPLKIIAVHNAPCSPWSSCQLLQWR